MNIFATDHNVLASKADIECLLGFVLFDHPLLYFYHHLANFRLNSKAKRKQSFGIKSVLVSKNVTEV